MKTLQTILLLSLITLMSCATDEAAPEDEGPLATATLDAGGGTLSVPNTGLQLVFPAGALSQPTAISVHRAPSRPDHTIETAVRLEPDGIQFAVPVELRFTYGAGKLPAGSTPDDVRVVTRVGSDWEDVPFFLADGTLTEGEVVASLEHFSDYAVIVVDPTALLRGAFGFAEDHAYAYSSRGIFRHDGGTNVATAYSSPTSHFGDGWGDGPTNHYAVGFEGVVGSIWHSTDGQGASWTPEALPPSPAVDQAFSALDGDASGVIAVGYDGRIVRGTTGAWVDESFRTPGGVNATVRNLYDVACLGGGDAVAVGQEIVLRRAGGTWTETDMSGIFGTDRFFLHGVWARADDDIYAVGSEFVNGDNVGVILQYDGAVWARSVVAPAPRFLGCWGDDDEVYAVGQQSVVWRRANGVWIDETNTSCIQGNTLNDVWATNPSSFHIVGGQGVLLRPGNACLTVGNPGGGGGGGGGDLVLELEGITVTGCNQAWTEDGVNLSVLNTLPEDGGMCFVGTCEMYVWEGKVNLLCGRLTADLGSQAFEYQKIEVDVSDNCNEGNCTKVVVYGPNGPLATGFSVSQSREEVTVTVNVPGGQTVERVVVLMTYGEVRQIRFFE